MIFYRTYLRPVIYKFSADVAGLCQRHLSERSRVLLACVLTGMVCGVGAWVMKYLMGITLCLISWPISPSSGVPSLWAWEALRVPRDR